MHAKRCDGDPCPCSGEQECRCALDYRGVACARCGRGMAYPRTAADTIADVLRIEKSAEEALMRREAPHVR